MPDFGPGSPAPAAEVEQVATPATPTRSPRRRRVRGLRPPGRTISRRRITKTELRLGALLFPAEAETDRPRTRGECRDEARPCPWVSCSFHLYLDVNPETGSIKINVPDTEPWDMPESCALDVAERGESTLEDVGEILNVSRERVRQIELTALLKLRMVSPSPAEVGAALSRRPGT